MKTLGTTTSLNLNITKPVEFKDMTLETNMLTLLVGMNGTGKTLIMKFVWLVNTHINMLLSSIAHGIPFDEIVNAQFLLDNTFTDNNITGIIKVAFQYGDVCSIEAEEGRVTAVKTSVDDEVVPGGVPVFMSKETRLFSDIVQYIKTKKILGLSSGMPTTESDMKKLLEMYRIYDIIYIEQFLMYIETRTSEALLHKFNEQMKKGFEQFDIELTDIRVDYTKSDILYSDDKHTDRSVTSLGAGHQSVLNMFLFQEYQTVKI